MNIDDIKKALFNELEERNRSPAKLIGVLCGPETRANLKMAADDIFIRFEKVSLELLVCDAKAYLDDEMPDDRLELYYEGDESALYERLHEIERRMNPAI